MLIFYVVDGVAGVAVVAAIITVVVRRRRNPFPEDDAPEGNANVVGPIAGQIRR